MLHYPVELGTFIDEIDSLQKDAFGVVHLEPPQNYLQKVHVEESLPWLQVYPLDLPKDELAVYFTKLKALFVRYRSFDFLKDMEFEQVLPAVASCIKGDSASIESNAIALEIDPAPYRFFLQELLRPLLKSWARFFRDYLDQERWHLNTCPVCGNIPAGGRHEVNEGRRFLTCSHCDTEWLFDRMTCPGCYNSNSSTMGYFTVEGIDNWRVSFCHGCTSYIKELLSGAPADAFDFKLAIQLDLLAEKEGFHPVGS